MSVPSPCFLLVDDHALFRTGLALMLPQHWPGARVMQAASWGEALLTLQRVAQPDLILLDVHLPDGHGLADLATIKLQAPTCPVVLISAEVSAAQVREAIAAGANAFVPKSASAGEVVAAVKAVLAGELRFIDLPYDAHPLGAGTAVPQAREPAPGLSARQVDILQYLGRGTPNKAIARHLGMSEAEVRAEVSWLTESLGANSREQAYANAVEQGWVRA